MTDEEKRLSRAASNRKYYEANKEKLKAQQREAYASDPASKIAQTSAYLKVNKDKRASWNRKYLLSKYGLSPERFEEMLISQHRACAICGTKEPSNVDHCHSTGVVRGLLCFSCNVGLGHFRDDTALLMSATEYLHASRTP